MTQTARERQEQYARKIVEAVWRQVRQRGGKLAGPQHMEECHRYAAVEDVPSYAGMRRPGESAMDCGIRVHKALEEARTEPPPAPVVEHECPSCGSKKISYNARADVWRCPLCSWSKRQLVAPPPGPKFKVGDWVRYPTYIGCVQVMTVKWCNASWTYSLKREVHGRYSLSVHDENIPENQLTLDPHRQAAAKMFGKPVAHVTSEERQAAKLKAFKDAYTPVTKGEFYEPKPGDRVRMLGKPPSWGTASWKAEKDVR